MSNDKIILDVTTMLNALDKVFGTDTDLEACSKKSHSTTDHWPISMDCPNWMDCDDPFYSYCGCNSQLIKKNLLRKELGL